MKKRIDLYKVALSDNPYRTAYTAEEIKKFNIGPDAIRAGFRGVSHWPPLTAEQEADLDYRVALTLSSAVIKADIEANPEITDQELLAKYVVQGLDPDLIRKAISRAR